MENTQKKKSNDRTEDSMWRQKYNFELHNLVKDENIVHYFKIACLRWIGHVKRINKQRIVQK